jgi:hypothetical protein
VLANTPDAAAITQEYRSRIKGLEGMLKAVEFKPVEAKPDEPLVKPASVGSKK